MAFSHEGRRNPCYRVPHAFSPIVWTSDLGTNSFPMLYQHNHPILAVRAEKYNRSNIYMYMVPIRKMEQIRYAEVRFCEGGWILSLCLTVVGRHSSRINLNPD